MNELENKLEEVAKEVQSIFGEKYTVRNTVVVKNNGTKAYGVIVQLNGWIVAITVYLSVRQLIDNTAVELADFVCSSYRDRLESGCPLDDVKNLEDSQYVLDNVVYQLINKQKNASLLETVPHKEILDLVLVYRVIVTEHKSEISSYVVDNKYLSRIGVNAEELDEAAQRNTISRFEVRYHGLKEFLEEVMGEDFLHEKLPVTLYLVTNKVCIYGASLLAYNSVFSELAEQLESNLIILPSSIDEVLVIVEDSDNFPGLEKLYEIVKIVNKSDAIPEEKFLSNSVYRFIKNTGVLQIA